MAIEYYTSLTPYYDTTRLQFNNSGLIVKRAVIHRCFSRNNIRKDQNERRKKKTKKKRSRILQEFGVSGPYAYNAEHQPVPESSHRVLLSQFRLAGVTRPLSTKNYQA